MPIPTTVCVICNETINKAQTYAISSGKRACKRHQEVQQQATAYQKTIQQQHLKGREVRKPRVQPQFDSGFLKPICSVCGVVGLKSQDFFYQVLLCHERFELVYSRPFDMFDQKDRELAYAPIKGLICLSWVKFTPDVHQSLLRQDFRVVAKMLGYFVACNPCCSNHKMEIYNPMEDTKLSLEDMIMLGEVVRPMIRHEAQQQLERSN